MLVVRRGSCLPDPRYDAVRAIAMVVMSDATQPPRDFAYPARLLLLADADSGAAATVGAPTAGGGAAPANNAAPAGSAGASAAAAAPGGGVGTSVGIAPGGWSSAAGNGADPAIRGDDSTTREAAGSHAALAGSHAAADGAGGPSSVDAGGASGSVGGSVAVSAVTETADGRCGLSGVVSACFRDERALLAAFVCAVRELDPDIVMGYDVMRGSLGYLHERAVVLEVPMLRCAHWSCALPTISRMILTVSQGHFHRINCLAMPNTLHGVNRLWAVCSLLWRKAPTPA